MRSLNFSIDRHTEMVALCEERVPLLGNGLLEQSFAPGLKPPCFKALNAALKGRSSTYQLLYAVPSELVRFDELFTSEMPGCVWSMLVSTSSCTVCQSLA